MKQKNKFWIYTLTLMGVLLMLTIGCKKEDDGKIPVLTTSAVNDITQTTANCGGNITTDGGSTVTARGVCWSTNQNPTIADTKTTDGTGTGSFPSNLTGLTANTTYYVRAYATNGAGTAYGEQQSFTTQSAVPINGEGVTDIDDNFYTSVIIGTQEWMAENLRVTKYRNGDLIGTTSPSTLDISSESTPKYEWAYDGNESNVATYGRLYTWYAVTDTREVCPTGWHAPSDDEWAILIDYLGGQYEAGGKLKETETTHWNSPNYGATNETGFTALPSGRRSSYGDFFYIGTVGLWWSSTGGGFDHAWIRTMDYGDGNVLFDTCPRNYALSVRCLKD